MPPSLFCMQVPLLGAVTGRADSLQVWEQTPRVSMPAGKTHIPGIKMHPNGGSIPRALLPAQPLCSPAGRVGNPQTP